ncbi:MAG: Flp pilus assembly complex ATPase component TadA, partial [Lachnospiraceae bacterium]|nr:Flp pilus assembly complex ATPase component TadA [Lachnospiraceae bacterium]
MSPDVFERCKENCKKELRNKIDYSREVSDEEIYEMIDELVIREGKKSALSVLEREQLGKELFYAIRKLDILQELVDDPDITEIMINGTDNIFIERQGRLQIWNKSFHEKEKLEDVIQQIVAKCNRTVNEANPIVDARLENGSRVNIVLAPVALNGP